jgi:hypothetical protein
MTARELLPTRRFSISFNFVHDELPYRCSASRFADGRLAEIFLTCSKAGSAAQAHADTAAIISSIALQHGISADLIARAVPNSAVAMAIQLAECGE